MTLYDSINEVKIHLFYRRECLRLCVGIFIFTFFLVLSILSVLAFPYIYLL